MPTRALANPHGAPAPKRRRWALLLVAPAVLLALALGAFLGFVWPCCSEILGLRDVLRGQGKELVIVRMPYRGDMYASKADPHLRQRLLPSRYAVLADLGAGLLRTRGVTVVDLAPDFRRESAARDLYLDDRMHLGDEGVRVLGGAMADRLAASGVLGPGIGKPGGATIMGECFAVQFGEVVREKNPGRDIRLLRAFGDQGRVASLLFTFPEQFLRGSTTVVWLLPNRAMAQSSFPRVQYAPREAAAIQDSAAAVALEGWPGGLEALRDSARKSAYADAVGCLRLRLENAEPPSREILAHSLVLQARKPTGFAEIARGDRLVVRLVPLDEWWRKHPALATTWRLHAPDDVETPEYWVTEWTKTP